MKKILLIILIKILLINLESYEIQYDFWAKSDLNQLTCDACRNNIHMWIMASQGYQTMLYFNHIAIF